MPKQCEICKIELGDHDFESHLLGKKHLRKVEAEEIKNGLLERSVYVSRIPFGLSLQGILHFFGQFGPIEQWKIEPTFAIIEYKQKEPVDFLLSKPIWMGKFKLDIRRRVLRENAPNTQDADESAGEIIFAELKTKLQSVDTFEVELLTFMETICLKDDQVQNDWKSLYSNLLDALRVSFRSCEIFRFGSSITGLGFKGSDFDVYLNIGQPICDDEENTNLWTLKRVFKEVKSLMYRKRNIFEKIVPIPKARTPIIKFCHTPTSTNCDISFKNGLGVINSQLIKLLLDSDERIKPLMIIIKFWAKTYELSGCGKFTNYAVVMLVVFYLQQNDTKLLPPIAELQKDCNLIVQWGWQVNFDRNFAFPPSTNTSSVKELVLGFFKFYVSFVFEKSVISPFDGCIHSREDFGKIWTEKGVDVENLALHKPVCLQDPIEHNNNITVGITAKGLEDFRRFCTVGVEVCGTALQSDEKPLLLNLFTTLPPRAVKNQNNQVTSEFFISACKTLRAGLPDDFDTRDDIEDKSKFIENNWCNVVEKLIEDTLTRVFKINVQYMKDERETKQQKIAATSDVHSNDSDRIVLECTGNFSVITGRKTKGFCIDPALGRIEIESRISDDVVKKQMEDGVKPIKLDFTCAIYREPDPLRLILRLQDHNSGKKQFRPFAAFLTTKLPSIVEKELIRMLQYRKR